MVNVVIYLNKTNDAEALVKLLLRAELIASAVIDLDNISYTITDGVFTKKIFNVVTAKSKSLLVNSIIEVVEQHISDDVLIIATPIVGHNNNFDRMVRQNTLPI